MGRRIAVVLALVVMVLVTSPLVVAARTTGSSTETSTTLAPVAARLPAAAYTTMMLAAMQALVVGSGANVGVTLVDLGGSNPITWSVDGDGVFTAASTYKLVALMMEAQNIAAGATDPSGLVCYDPSDYEDGWFDDYAPGVCFTRDELASRAAKESDNTAGHMLVRDVGGADALNAWAAAVGATNSVFFTDNTTTATDLATLWTAEANGSLGGAAAQAWLYPLLTGTTTEAGIPAGTPAGTTVIHKTGAIDAVENDAAFVASGPDGPYVLVVLTDGLGGAAGWQLISGVSAAVWQTEVSRLV